MLLLVERLDQLFNNISTQNTNFRFNWTKTKKVFRSGEWHQPLDIAKRIRCVHLILYSYQFNCMFGNNSGRLGVELGN